MRRLALVLAAIILLPAAGARAHHSGSCSVPSGAPSLTVDGPPTPGIVEPNTINRYRLVIEDAGEHYLAVQPFNGDVWVQVCKVGQLAAVHACRAGNFGILPELCAVDGLEGNPGAGPPLRGTGTYLVMVKHCLELDSGAGDCDYSQGLAPPGAVPAAPIAYAAVVFH